MGITTCPAVLFIPRSCDGFTDWCKTASSEHTESVGCADFVESCNGTKLWDGVGEVADWLAPLIEAEGEPQVNPRFETYAKQGRWIRHRDDTTEMTHLRNNFLAQGMPAFTAKGYDVIPIPPEFSEWLYSFWERHTGGTNIRPLTANETLASRKQANREARESGKYPSEKKNEIWSTAQTQCNVHEVPLWLVDMDMERTEANEHANRIVKPMLEEWCGYDNLELTSFYGIREYEKGHLLKNHIDRIDTHVISATLTLAKLDDDGDVIPLDDAETWPLEGVNWQGENVRYLHPVGSMVLYESAKFIHGRPYRNPTGRHVGAFLHYRTSKGTLDWVPRGNMGKEFMQDNYQVRNYESTPSMEPENPVFSRVYAELTEWDGEEGEPEQFRVFFKNNGPRHTTVYWQGKDENVEQCQIAVGKQCIIHTYANHKFFFSEKPNVPKAAEYGSFTASEGIDLYVFDGEAVHYQDSEEQEVLGAFVHTEL
jgi:hypothetical protein